MSCLVEVVVNDRMQQGYRYTRSAPMGEDFDPHFHSAVTYEPAEGRRDGEVIEEFARGYMLGDRLLRPAVVKVAKGQE